MPCSRSVVGEGCRLVAAGPENGRGSGGGQRSGSRPTNLTLPWKDRPGQQVGLDLPGRLSVGSSRWPRRPPSPRVGVHTVPSQEADSGTWPPATQERCPPMRARDRADRRARADTVATRPPRVSLSVTVPSRGLLPSCSCRPPDRAEHGRFGCSARPESVRTPLLLIMPSGPVRWGWWRRRTIGASAARLARGPSRPHGRRYA